VAVDQSTERSDAAPQTRSQWDQQHRTGRGNAFDLVRRAGAAPDQFDTIVVDPPAFRQDESNLERAVAGTRRSISGR